MRLPAYASQSVPALYWVNKLSRCRTFVVSKLMDRECWTRENKRKAWQGKGAITMVNQLLDNSFGRPISPFFTLRLSKVIRQTCYIELLSSQVEVFGRDLLFLFDRVGISVDVLSE